MTELRVLNTRPVLKEGSNEDWFYNPKVKDHFFNPRNVLTKEEEKNYAADGIGMIGSPACGDGIKMFIKVDGKEDRIVDVKWQTYGCGTALASTSAFSVMLMEKGGMKIEAALKIKPKDITDYLGGIPPRKFHCSVLADKVFREAVNDYFRKTGQLDRIVEKKAKIVDKVLKITDVDIEHAVLDGAVTFEEVQRKTKVGIHDKECVQEVKDLIESYKKKYYGDD